MEFDSYKFTFSRGTDVIDDITKSKSDSNSLTFTLPSGTGYSLAVNVYKDGVKVASGSSLALFNVGSGTATEVPVTLSGFTNGEGEGIFTYNVTFPEGASIVQFELLANGNKPIELDLSGAGTTDPIASGWYFLVIQLEMGRAEAGYANGVLIYTGQTTDFTKVFAENEFQIPPGSSSPVSNWDSNGKTFAVTGGNNTDFYIDSNKDLLTNILTLTDCDSDSFTYTAGNTGIYDISVKYKAEGADEWTTDTWPVRVEGDARTFSVLPEDVSGTVLVQSANVSFGEDLLTITPSSFELVANGPAQTMTANIGNDNVIWYSPDNNIATVDEYGVVHAAGVAGGTVVITATSKEYPALNSAAATVNVCDDNLVISLKWDSMSFSFISDVGSEITLIRPAGTVTLVASDTASTYQWYVDGKEIDGATGKTFVFNSAEYLLKTYNIGLRIGSVGGDAVQIIVTDK